MPPFDEPSSTLAPPPRPPLTDSPWFWALAFSAMGVLAIVVIAPKYDRRQQRLEARYLGRQRVAEEIAARQAANEQHIGDESGRKDESESDPPSNWSKASAPENGRPAHPSERNGMPEQRMVPLDYLLAFAMGAMIFSGAMLWRSRRAARA